MANSIFRIIARGIVLDTVSIINGIVYALCPMSYGNMQYLLGLLTKCTQLKDI